MQCAICKKEMHISEGLTEHDGKKCHVECKKKFEKEWRKQQGLDRF